MLPYFSLQFLLVSAIATVLAIYAHHWLPAKRLSVFPNPKHELVIIYDGKRGGNSRGYWDEQQPTKAICDVRPSEVFPFCGLLVSLGDGLDKGVDFSRYDTLRLTVGYSGPAERLRVFMRNYRQEYSIKGKPETSKFNNVIIPVADLGEPLNLTLADFSVAEWWLSYSGVSREFSQPEFGNVIKFGLDLSDPVPQGRHELQLVRLELIGKWVTEKQWYLGILLFWLIFAAALTAKHNGSIRRRRATDHLWLAQLHELSAKASTEQGTDPITGAKTRAGLATLIQEIDRRPDNYPYAVALIDIDSFGKIHRRFGQDGGNAALAQVSRILLANSRGSDGVCRWSDDRFLVLAPGARASDIAVYAEKIRSLIQRHRFEINGASFSVTASVGVAESGSDGRFQQVFDAANRALLGAKSSGKNATQIAGR